MLIEVVSYKNLLIKSQLQQFNINAVHKYISINHNACNAQIQISYNHRERLAQTLNTQHNSIIKQVVCHTNL